MINLLGVLNQKQPEIWVSHPFKNFTYSSGVMVISLLDTQLISNLQYHLVSNQFGFKVAINNQQLLSAINQASIVDTLQVAVAMANQQLLTTVGTTQATHAIAVNIHIQNQVLGGGLFYAHSLDDCNAKLAVTLQPQQLYQEYL